MLTAAKGTKTYADYAAMEEGAPIQLIDGELIVSPAPSRKHQAVLLDLAVRLRGFVAAHTAGEVYIAPFDVKLSDTDVYQPDVLFVAANHLHRLTEQHLAGAPDLVMEVLSPSTGYYDLTHKRRVYASSGVQEYWLVDPHERTVEVLVPIEGVFEAADRAIGHGRVASRLLDGFEVDLDALFNQ